MKENANVVSRRKQELLEELKSPQWVFKQKIDNLYVHAFTMFMLQKNKYPWMVDISLNSEFYCGGTLVASKYVVTRAECLFYSNDSAVATSDVQVILSTRRWPYSLVGARIIGSGIRIKLGIWRV